MTKHQKKDIILLSKKPVNIYVSFIKEGKTPT